MKKIIVLLTTFLTVVAFAQSAPEPAAPYVNELPDDPVFDQPITLSPTDPSGIPLDRALSLAARSVGLTPIFSGVPDKPIVDPIKDKPFRQVWDLLLSVYANGELDYVVLPNDVIVVAPSPVVQDIAQKFAPPVEVDQAPSEPAAQEPAAEAEPQTEPAPVAQPPALTKEEVLNKVLDYFLGSLKTPDEAQSSGSPANQATADEPATATPAATDTQPKQPREQPVFKIRYLGDLYQEGLELLKRFAPENLEIQPLPERQTVIFYGTPKSIEQASRVLALLQNLPLPKPDKRETPKDEPAKTEHKPTVDYEPYVQVYPVDGDPSKVVPILLKAAGEPAPTIEPLPERKALFVKATPPQHVAILRMLNAISQTDPYQAKDDEQGKKITRAAYRLQYADAKPTASALTELFTRSVQGLKVITDDRTNTLYIQAPRNAIEKITAFLNNVDKPVPQAELRVRIEQVNYSNSRDLGIEWSTQAGSFSIGFIPSNPLVQVDTSTGLPLAVVAKLNALEQKGRSKSLLNTRMLTQDRIPAKINSGGTLILPQTQSGGGDNQGGQGGAATYEFGLGVEITPYIASERELQLEVKTQLGDLPSDGPGGGILIPSQAIQNRINLEAGKTIVLGGVITERTQKSEKGIPVLSAIPLIGDLFKTETTSDSSSILLIFITANVQMPQIDQAKTTENSDNPQEKPSESSATPELVTLPPLAPPSAPIYENRGREYAVPVGGEQ